MNMPSGQFICGTRYMYYGKVPSEPCWIGIQVEQAQYYSESNNLPLTVCGTSTQELVILNLVQ